MRLRRNQTASSWSTRMRRAALVVLALALGTLHVDVRADQGAAIPEAIASLAADDYAAELAWWADDERGGREPGDEGSLQAVARAAERFRALGLRPAGDAVDGVATYFQILPRGGKMGVGPGALLAVDGAPLELGNDWSLLGGSGDVGLEGVEVAFAGYGITAPEHGYDDYDGIDVRGKAVLVLRYEPQEMDEASPWRGTAHTQHAGLRTKLQNAAKRGAALVVLVDGPLHHDPERDSLLDLARAPMFGEKVPMVHVRGRVADAILGGGGALRALQETIDRTGEPASRLLEGVRLDLRAKVLEVSKARNVMALLEGADPGLRDEVVVLGAHHDHIGRGAYGSLRPDRIGEIHNGANDNASGSVGVLDIAEAIVRGGLRPRRSVLFQLYDAEEKGLIGSRHFVERPTVPLERIVAMINLDMIASVEKWQCGAIGTRSAPEWDAILAAAEEGSPVRFPRRGGAFGGSDHDSFARKGIPVIFFSSAVDSLYHTPDDDASRANVDGAVEVLKVALKTLLLVTDREGRLTYQRQVEGRRRRV